MRISGAPGRGLLTLVQPYITMPSLTAQVSYWKRIYESFSIYHLSFAGTYRQIDEE
jgi:hypothetical protein